MLFIYQSDCDSVLPFQQPSPRTIFEIGTMIEDASVLQDMSDHTLGPQPGTVRAQMAGSGSRESNRLVLEAKGLCTKAVDIRTGQA